jgi:hypothetical protein
LNDYETGMLETSGVVVGKNRWFFEVAKALLREGKFDGLLADGKADKLEGRKARTNPTARLIHRIMNAVGGLASQTKGSVSRN